MSVNYEMRYGVHPEDYAGYNNSKLRKNFQVSGLFVSGEINLTYTQIDRFIIAGVQPAKAPMKLENIPLLKSQYFLERRELGAINVGGPGTVVVDGKTYELDYKEALYVGAGSQEVCFGSNDASNPAKFYINSATAHASYTTRKVGKEDADVVQLGAQVTSNERVINKLLVNNVVETCQLQMGLTELRAGSVWNTMPAHTHSRRMETYFYFEVAEDQAVCHFMGPEHETRHIWIANEQAVISPAWSMHAGAGTSNYSFIWGMAGENLDYDDMDMITPADLAAARED